MTTLAPFLAYPLHVASWGRPAGNIDYRITNPYNGPDLVNGGIHRAVDVGNTRRGDTIRAPATCKARGLLHTDGAIGVQFDLGGGWLFELWHLDRTALPGYSIWTPVAAGQAIGVTGASGRVAGAHTHIELKRNGEKVDPEPYLPIVERKIMAIPGATAGGGTFTDVPPDHRFYTPIEWAAREGIIYGLPDGRYVPDGTLTRGQAAALLHRFARRYGLR